MSVKFPVLGGGAFWVLGGGSADFIFMGTGIFLIESEKKPRLLFVLFLCF